LGLASCSESQPAAVEPSTAAAPVFSPPAQVPEPKLKFELTLRLDDPTDLRVQEGDRITKGQVVAERRPNEQQVYARSRLQAQLQQRRGIPEEGQLIALKGELAALQTLAASSSLVHSLEARLITVQSEHRATTYQLQQLPLRSGVIDPAYRSQSYRDKQATLEAKRIQEQTEIALLQPQIQQAKWQAQQEHRAKMAEKRAAIAGVQVQVAEAKMQVGLERQQIQDQLHVLQGELERLKLRSPYAGVIRRLKVERGTNNEVVARVRIVGE
jgi:biotin carboxyl carrier protein